MIGGILTPAFNFAFSGAVRYFWVYVICGLLIAWVAYSQHGGSKAFFGDLFRWDVWLSKSAQNDYAVLIINPVLLLLVSSWVFLNGEELAGGVSHILTGLGVQGNATPAWQVVFGTALTVSLFLVDDFIRWLGHFLHHKIPLLWELHKVHHSAEVLNFATAERFHPIELIIMSGLFAVSAAFVNGVFIALFGGEISILTIAGANILWIGANVIGGVLRHSPFWVSFGPKVERWLISPAMHQIHHSDDPIHFDSNFGGTLAVWDRWFGTIYIPKGREIINYGIGPETAEYRSLPALYLRPIAGAARTIAQWFNRSSNNLDDDSQV